MNRADEIGLPSLIEVSESITSFREQLVAFLKESRYITPTTPLDILGLGFALKGSSRFQDILLLVENHRFIGAEALLRGLWESRTIFRYLIKCSNNPQKAAEAYGTYMDFYFADKGRKAKTIAATQLPEVQAKFVAYEQAFNMLSDEWQSFCKTSSNTKGVCLCLDKKSPLPLLMDGIQPSHENEYYMVFNPYSTSAHGSLADAQRYFASLDEGLSPSNNVIDDMSRGLSVAAYLWMKEILQIWAESMKSSPYLPLFTQHFPALMGV